MVSVRTYNQVLPCPPNSGYAITNGHMVPKYSAISSQTAGILTEAGNNLPRSIAAAARLTKGPRVLVTHFQPIRAGYLNWHNVYAAHGLSLAVCEPVANTNASGSEGSEGMCGLG